MPLKDSTKSKNSSRGTNSFFMCFRPVDLEPDQPVRTYMASMTVRDGDVVLPRNDSDGLSFEKQEDGGDFAGKKISRSSSSRRFSRVWKTVFFEPAKKTKKANSDKKSPNSLTIESARYNYKQPSNKDGFDFGGRRISRSVSALATSSSASTATSEFLICPSCSSLITETPPFGLPNPNESGKRNNIDSIKKGNFYYNYGCNVGLFLMLISLVVLVFWGKVCAIFCTSTFFFTLRWVVNDRNRNVNSSLTLKKLSESKRKIVMEGLLSRERGSIR